MERGSTEYAVVATTEAFGLPLKGYTDLQQRSRVVLMSLPPSLLNQRGPKRPSATLTILSANACTWTPGTEGVGASIEEQDRGWHLLRKSHCGGVVLILQQPLPHFPLHLRQNHATSKREFGWQILHSVVDLVFEMSQSLFTRCRGCQPGLALV